MKLALAAAAALLLSACANTGIVRMDGDTYLVSDKSAQVGFGPATGSRAKVYEQANEKCAAMGREVETVNLEMIDSGFARPASATLQFRCKPKA